MTSQKIEKNKITKQNKKKKKKKKKKKTKKKNNNKKQTERPRVTTHGRDRHSVTSNLQDRLMSAIMTPRNTPGTHNNSASGPCNETCISIYCIQSFAINFNKCSMQQY